MSLEGKLADVEAAAANMAFMHRSNRERRAAADVPSENMNELIRRVAGASTGKIDRAILELQGVRDMLRSEGERVCREITGYESLNNASLNAMKLNNDSLRQWKDTKTFNLCRWD